MRKVYTSIDLGSDSIKIVVAEKINKRFHVLAAKSIRSVGIKKGIISDVKMAASSIKLAKEEIEKEVDFKINQAIITVPSNNCIFDIVKGDCKISGDDSTVIGADISNCIKQAVLSKRKENYEVVTVEAIQFNVDDGDGIKNPFGLYGDELSVKAVMTSVPKAYLYPIIEVFKQCNIEIVDMAFSATGDYYEIKSKESDSKVGAIINIGADITNVSIYNKGIMIKNKILEFGSKNIDNDISYVYRVDGSVARSLKETFAVSNKKYTDSNDVVEIKSKVGEKLIINQYEISDVVESRLVEILKFAKNSINDLTKREISYIIVTGGISELAGFQYVIENVFGKIAVVHNITNMGIRNNKYSSAIGLIKYFDYKMNLRDREFSMISDDKALMNKRKSTVSEDNNIISRVFDMFTGN